MSGSRGPGLVAAGHPATATAMAAVLRSGGNAFDAVVAGGLAAAVAEPILTSPAGGGFLLARTAVGEELVLDAFVAAPGLGRGPVPVDGLVPVPIRFGSAVQDFHVGPASVATPGLLAGYLAIHDRLGRLELDALVRPAVALARDGVVVDSFGAQLLGLVEPILARTAAGRSLFFRDERPLAEGELFVNPGLGEFLDEVGRGLRGGFRADELGGAVTDADLRTYRVEAREPRRLRYRDAEVLTNPAPSFGGALVAHGLELIGSGPPVHADDPAGAVRMAGALVAQAEERSRLGPGASRGTTHLAASDRWGNVASMTTSNGSGSGEFAGDTGVQLNNVMGEEDLHPAGFGSLPPGERVGSMMCPTLVEWRATGRVVSFGSGGSERIRSALTQVVVHLVDDRRDLAAAVRAPRLHWDGTRLQAEPGFAPALLDALAARWELNVWQGPDLYFGGVHGVEPPSEAIGDARRGGVGLVVTA